MELAVPSLVCVLSERLVTPSVADAVVHHRGGRDLCATGVRVHSMAKCDATFFSFIINLFG